MKLSQVIGLCFSLAFSLQCIKAAPSPQGYYPYSPSISNDQNPYNIFRLIQSYINPYGNENQNYYYPYNLQVLPNNGMYNPYASQVPSYDYSLYQGLSPYSVPGYEQYNPSFRSLETEVQNAAPGSASVESESSADSPSSKK